MTGILVRVQTRFNRDGFTHYLKSLRYCLYTMVRPLDGFWDLIHEKRGSLAAANTIVIAAVIVNILRVVLTNFQFMPVNMEAFSAVWVVGETVMWILLFTVANWSLTTLFDGKGRMRDIYMGYAYAMAPQVIILAVQIPLSHILTYGEGAVHVMMSTIAFGWFILLVLCAMKEIHDYSFSKAVLTSILTLFAIAIMVFIFIMFFAVVSDGFAYFTSIGQEAMLRVRRG